MEGDPIIKEVRENRRALMAEYNNSLDDLIAALQERERTSGRKIVSLPRKPVSQPREK